MTYQEWFLTLDPFWQRYIRIKIKPELESNRAARDKYLPENEDLGKMAAESHVKLAGVSIPDLEPLKFYDKIEKLELSGLQKLKGLESLHNNNTIKQLHLNDLNFPDFSVINSMQALTGLSFNHSGIKSLSDISFVKNLSTLYLKEPGISDISELVKFEYLEGLSLIQLNTSNIEALAKITYLTNLVIESMPVSNIAPILKLDLHQLALVNLPIDSIAGFENFKNLFYLNVQNTKVSTLTPLANLKKLKAVNIFRTEIKDLSPLDGKASLESIQLSEQIIPGKEIRRFELANPKVKIITELGDYPLRTYHHYVATQTINDGRSDIREGEELEYLSSQFNHYDSEEIVYFKTLSKGQNRIWITHRGNLDSARDIFTRIDFKEG